MTIKIQNWGWRAVWILRKYCSNFTSKVALTYADARYKKEIRRYIDQFMSVPSEEIPLFKIVNIETVNRCNGRCAFCPANTYAEKRPYKKMSPELYQKILGELREIGWYGQIFLNVNNEPFIDNFIIDKAKQAREMLGPNLELSIISNGTLITVEKLTEMGKWCNTLYINNYSESYALTPHNQQLYKFAVSNRELFKNMKIVFNRRYSKEILASRAGNAPNKPQKNIRIVSPCIYPFTDITIFPDGKVGLCCNDCFEITDFGDVNNDTMKDIWKGDPYRLARAKIATGRENYPFCKECDVSDSGFRERVIK